jgi:hypothetical protein
MTREVHVRLAMAAVAIGGGASACTAQPTGTVPTHDAAAAPVIGSFDAGASDADNADTDDEGEAAAACSAPLECAILLPFAGWGIYCCIDHVCTGNVPKTCPDGSSRPIKASNYDQSCKTDMDCVVINEGNACSGISNCGAAAINRSAYAQYQSDIANRPCASVSSCGRTGAGPCCRNGQCQWSIALCDALPACVDAGGTCAVGNSPVCPKGNGPMGSCAEPIETCCLQ